MQDKACNLPSFSSLPSKEWNFVCGSASLPDDNGAVPHLRDSRSWGESMWPAAAKVEAHLAQYGIRPHCCFGCASVLPFVEHIVAPKHFKRISTDYMFPRGGASVKDAAMHFWQTWDLPRAADHLPPGKLSFNHLTGSVQMWAPGFRVITVHVAAVNEHGTMSIICTGMSGDILFANSLVTRDCDVGWLQSEFSCDIDEELVFLTVDGRMLQERDKLITLAGLTCMPYQM
mmetsp:Transcript_11283/g.21260  ORF Transcript_11283/g.21260 Transcript_11283/m.21260 type:complete len:230 (-) Transcript_11283:19-708(-)